MKRVLCCLCYFWSRLMFGINPKRIVVKININKNNSFIVIKYGTNKVHHSLVVAVIKWPKVLNAVKQVQVIFIMKQMHEKKKKTKLSDVSQHRQYRTINLSQYYPGLKVQTRLRRSTLILQRINEIPAFQGETFIQLSAGIPPLSPSLTHSLRNVLNLLIWWAMTL